MAGRFLRIRIALTVSLILFGAATTAPMAALWGVNHAAFLPWPLKWLVISLAAAGIVLVWLPRRSDSGISSENSRARAPAAVPHLWFLALTAVFSVVFFIGRTRTCFLGDGAIILSLFTENHYDIIRGWPEPLAIPLIQWIQSWLEGSSRQTAMTAFRLTSLLCGIGTVYLSLRLSWRLGATHRSRAFIAISLLGSGSILLFFGYIEYYPLVWMAAALFLITVVHCVLGRAPLATTWVTFALMVLMHLEALMLLPGMAYLTAVRMFPARRAQLGTVRLWVPLYVVVTAVIMIWIGRQPSPSADNSVFLSPLVGPLGDTDYCALGITHLADIANLFPLIFPGILVLLTAVMSERPKTCDRLDRFLLANTGSSLMFLLLINPVLGLAKDWDLFAFCLWSPGLFLVRRAGRLFEGLPPLLLGAYALVCLIGTGGFVTLNALAEPAAHRAGLLLQREGNRDPLGWTFLALWHLDRSNDRQVVAFTDLMIRRNIAPGRAHHIKALLSLDAGKLQEAERHLRTSLTYYPDDPSIYAALGRAYVQGGRAYSAMLSLEMAHRLAPGKLSYLQEYLIAAFKAGDRARAACLADSLVLRDPESASAHLMRMLCALDLGESTVAARHYRLFLRYGRGHPDYARIRQEYGSLLADAGGAPAPDDDR